MYLICLIDAKEEKRSGEDMLHFHYITYLSTPQHNIPAPGMIKFTILLDPSLVIISILSVWLICLGVEEKK